MSLILLVKKFLSEEDCQAHHRESLQKQLCGAKGHEGHVGHKEKEQEQEQEQ